MNLARAVRISADGGQEGRQLAKTKKEKSYGTRYIARNLSRATRMAAGSEQTFVTSFWLRCERPDLRQFPIATAELTASDLVSECAKQSPSRGRDANFALPIGRSRGGSGPSIRPLAGGGCAGRSRGGSAPALREARPGLLVAQPGPPRGRVLPARVARAPSATTSPPTHVLDP